MICNKKKINKRPKNKHFIIHILTITKIIIKSVKTISMNKIKNAFKML